jgi:predicted metal-binding membrane protein
MTATTVGALALTLGVGAAGWVLAIDRMSGMDMGVSTRLGSLPFFLSLWVPMMAAMMLPGAAPAVVRVAQAGCRALHVSLFVGSYLVVWALFGLAVYALYTPHGTVTAGAFVLGAGLYELTPVKLRFRESCRAMAPSGWGLGVCCVGSSAGLMLMMVALGAMSLAWMALITGVVFGQKLLAPRAVVDVPVALCIVALGIAVLVAPASVPGLVPAMHPMTSM